MANVLLNLSNFDAPWAYASLAQYLTPDKKVLILPLSYHEDWITDALEWQHEYGKGTDGYEMLIRPFLSYGIPEKNIRWINYYEDDEVSARHKLEWADVLFFTGGYPDWMLQRLYDFELEDAVRNFDGVIMGTSAGALIQLEEYHLTPEEDYEFQYQYGLGILSGFDLEVHYEEDARHLEAIIRTIEEKNVPVIAVPNEGGVLIDGDHFELLGGSFILDWKNLDELYQTYEYLRDL